MLLTMFFALYRRILSCCPASLFFCFLFTLTRTCSVYVYSHVICVFRCVNSHQDKRISVDVASNPIYSAYGITSSVQTKCQYQNQGPLKPLKIYISHIYFGGGVSWCVCVRTWGGGGVKGGSRNPLAKLLQRPE